MRIWPIRAQAEDDNPASPMLTRSTCRRSSWRTRRSAIFKITEEVLAMAADAKRMPAREAAFRNLVLNQKEWKRARLS